MAANRVPALRIAAEQHLMPLQSHARPAAPLGPAPPAAPAAPLAASRNPLADSDEWKYMDSAFTELERVYGKPASAGRSLGI